MNLTVVENELGQKTLYRADIQETYHSIHGAIAESKHVFIEAGLKYWLNRSVKQQLSILEVGFGTGLNAMLTLLESNVQDNEVWYTALETLALPYSLIAKLEYQKELSLENEKLFSDMHLGDWEVDLPLTANFVLYKTLNPIETFLSNKTYDLIYFDAFGPDKQSELWQPEIFKKIFGLMNSGGVFVTYSAKGDVRRSLLAAGFEVTKLEGPPHKRHMLRAIKH
ncbi:MAG: tRNA (5-methylaminomethyl-2-thiouridine)(34)-methyltransferase MnmD [bacterium]|nr:tRNA (5-methylaminomethyl-2-thiouridine)(34)-methyltransferase MnmD [bacterium]